MSPLQRIADLVHRESGVHVPIARRAAIERALAHVAPAVKADEFLDAVQRDPESLARLLDEITIKETFFFRDERQLRSIDWHSLHASAVAQGSDAIEVWTAGCATGEEPYTLSLLALEAFGDTPPPVRILGTDISRTALEHAQGGRYRERSLRHVSQAQRALHFAAAADGSAAIAGAARNLVRFGHHNLVRDAAPAPGEGRFDLVVCRNVLIYFDAETVAAVVDRLRGALRPGGRLVLGAGDALCVTGLRLSELLREPEAHAAGHRPKRGRRPTATRRIERQANTRPRPHVAPAREPEPEPEPVVPAGDDAATQFVQGLVELEAGRPETAVTLLRRTLYLDPGLAVAAFQLGRAYEAVGDAPAARRAYEQTLRTLAESPDEDALLEQIDPADVIRACRSRVEALS